MSQNGFDPVRNQGTWGFPHAFKDGVLVAIPTFGMVPIQFLQSQVVMATPIHTTIGYAFVIGEEIGKARNLLAEQAIEQKYKYILFRDDDVMIPREALQRLYGLHAPITAGVYYSKTYPPEPLIFKNGHIAGVQEWSVGDILRDVDSCGMGCTMIETEVFLKLKESNPDLPFFKTEDVTLSLRGNAPGVMTEDIFFLTRCKDELRVTYEKVGDTIRPRIWTAKEAPEGAESVRPVIDTGLQCAHIDSRTWTQFFFHEGLKVPVWTDSMGNVHAIPPIGSDVYSKFNGVNGNGKHPEAERYADGELKLNLGSGGVHVDGWIDVDLNPDTKPEIVADCSDLSWVEKRLGRKADAIRSSHSLEHFPHVQVLGIVRSWTLALKEGGSLELGVPDFWWCVDELKKNEEMTFSWQRVFGGQKWTGDEHRTGFSEARLRGIFRALPWMEITSIETTHPDTANQPTIWLKAVRKVAVPGHVQAEETNMQEEENVMV
jgi:hypothetical protein